MARSLKSLARNLFVLWTVPVHVQVWAHTLGDWPSEISAEVRYNNNSPLWEIQVALHKESEQPQSSAMQFFPNLNVCKSMGDGEDFLSILPGQQGSIPHSFLRVTTEEGWCTLWTSVNSRTSCEQPSEPMGHKNTAIKNRQMICYPRSRFLEVLDNEGLRGVGYILCFELGDHANCAC